MNAVHRVHRPENQITRSDRDGNYLVHGPVVGDIDLASVETTFLPEAENEWAGYAVSAAGDVDGDGRADLLIAVPGDYYVNEERHGKAYLYLGPIESGALLPTEATWVFVGEELADWAASSIDSAGDVNGDGLDDLLFGAPENDEAGERAGKAYLWLGRWRTIRDHDRPLPEDWRGSPVSRFPTKGELNRDRA